MSKNITSLTFAGQAGFMLESKDGYRIGIDLYLSDCCYRYFGFKRILPFLFNPLDLELDLLIATHAHYDHFDPDSIPLIMSNSKTKLLCAKDCFTEAERLGLQQERITYISQQDTFEDCGISVKAMPCDHGPETPDAIGLLIEIDGKKIYIAGDTCFREDNFRNEELKNCDIMIMPINGAFGNLNEIEGAKAAGIINPKLCIPCHFWNFTEHGGNPQIFIDEIDKNLPHINYLVMRAGEKYNF